MLDKNCINVLKALSKLIFDDGFKIIEKTEIIKSAEETLTIANLEKAISNLTDSKDVVLKYKDNDEYCLAITRPARLKIKELEVIEVAKLDEKIMLKKNDAGNTVFAVSKFEKDNESEILTPNEGLVVKTLGKKVKLGRLVVLFYGILGGAIGGLIMSLIFWLIVK